MSDQTGQCPSESLPSFYSLAQFISCTLMASLRKWQAGGRHVMIPPPTIAQPETMTLLLPLVQERKQENQLNEVKQVPPKLIKKLQTGLKVVLSAKQEKHRKAS
jgi:hypothetical protein